VRLMRLAGIVAVSGLMLVPPPSASAQSDTVRQATAPTTTRAARERLAVFEGTWTMAGDTSGPAFRETCEWLPGERRHMICRPRFETESGVIEHRTIYSYRPADSTYVVTALLAQGQVLTYHGRVEGDRWTFDLQPGPRNDTQRLRMIVTMAPDTIHFVEESSENGGPWRVTEDYRYARLRDAPAAASGSQPTVLYFVRCDPERPRRAGRDAGAAVRARRHVCAVPDERLLPRPHGSAVDADHGSSVRAQAG